MTETVTAEHRGYRIVAYRQGRRLRPWNARYAPLDGGIGPSFRLGDPFDARTPERAIAKAISNIDRSEAILARESELFLTLNPDGRTPPRPR